MDRSLLVIAKRTLRDAKSYTDVNNWLYRHPRFLRKFGIINGEIATQELKQVAEHQISVSHYAGAMATLRKLNDLRTEALYDDNSYELISLDELKRRIFHSKSN